MMKDEEVKKLVLNILLALGLRRLGLLKVLPRSFALGGYADDDSQVFL